MDFYDCDNNIITLDQVLSALLTKTATGEWALRTMDVTACADDAVDCDNNAVPNVNLLKKIIGINACGKPAIRLAVQAVE